MPPVSGFGPILARCPCILACRDRITELRIGADGDRMCVHVHAVSGDRFL